MDHYTTLGVQKGASQEDIKKAYRKLAMQHHPDRTGGDDTKFKQIQEAYATLSDVNKRAEYDNPQPQHNFGNPFGGMGGFEDIFAQQFGFNVNRGRPRHQHKNKDVQLHYVLDIVDCFNGKGMTVRYRLPSGRNEFVDVAIPPGCKDGDLVKISGYGDDTVPHLPRGDLLLRISIRKDKYWSIDGLDVLHSLDIDIFDLIIGTEKVIVMPTGKSISLTIPRGSQPGVTFRIQGYGIPNNQTGRTGILFVKLNASVPKIDDIEIIDQLRLMKQKI
tara:strand:- start:4004 stop:4825 length:822 start_codon:yes stop_codon:yes gene_type:complete